MISPGEGPLNHQVTVAQASGGGLTVNVVSGLIDSEVIASYMPWYAQQAEMTLVSGEERGKFAREFKKAYAIIRYISVLLFAMAGWLLYRRRQPYFVCHLIGGLHFYSFWFAIAVLTSLPARLNPSWNNLSVLAYVYLFLALDRLFHERWYIRLAKTTALYLFANLTELGLGYAAARWIERWL
jgi:hypothetical protein